MITKDKLKQLGILMEDHNITIFHGDRGIYFKIDDQTFNFDITVTANDVIKESKNNEHKRIS